MSQDEFEDTLATAYKDYLQKLEVATSEVMKEIEDLSPNDAITIGMNSDGSKFIANLIRIDPNQSSTTRFVDATGNKIFVSWQIPSRAAQGFWYRIPERTLDKKNSFIAELAMTDYTVLVTLASWPESKIIFKDEMSKTAFKVLRSKWDAQTTRAAMAARFKLDNVVPPLPKYWIAHPDPKRQLSNYQIAAAVFALSSTSSAFFMDRGTGKTATAIQVMSVLAAQQKGKMLRVLVVCPPQVRLNWQNEIRDFCSVRGKVTTIRCSKLERLALLATAMKSESDCMFSAVIIGYDTYASTPNAFKRIPWDLVICDESHFFKYSQTKRFKALKELREATKRRLILTGTPIGNSMMDLWSQLEFLEEGGSGFSTFKAFRAFHGKFETQYDGTGIQKLIGINNVPLIRERLSRMAFSITKQEAGLNLPDKAYELVEVEMTPRQAKFYDQLANSLLIEIEDRMSKSASQGRQSLEVNNILTSLLRLAQITSGFVSWDPTFNELTGEQITARKIEQIDPGENPKIAALIELLTDEDRDKNGKTVIWAIFVEDIKTICKALAEAGIVHGHYYGATTTAERDSFVHRFNNDPTFKVLVCNPQTAGEGLNLLGYDPKAAVKASTYCDLEIFYSQNWSAILRAQAEDRAHRRGTEVQVCIVDLVVPNTIDQEIRERVKGKQMAALEISDVREILERLRSGSFINED